MEARSVGFKVSLTPEIFRKLKVVADRQGMPHSVVGALAIGEYVARHYGQVETIEKVAEITEKALAELPRQLELMHQELEGQK